MVDLRAAAASFLGVAIGIFLVAYPEVVVRAHTAGRLPNDRGGEYGTDGTVPARWRRLVRLAGVGSILVGFVIARSAFL